MVRLRNESGVRRWPNKELDLGGFSTRKKKGKERPVSAMFGTIRVLQNFLALLSLATCLHPTLCVGLKVAFLQVLPL